MGCQCKGADAAKDISEIYRLLERVDLRDVFEQASSTTQAVGSAIRHVTKAERAERLGMGAEVSAIYRTAAERDQRQALRQFGAVLARLDERTARDDWHALAAAMDEEFRTRDGAALVEDAKERFRLAVFETDGIAAEVAGEAVDLHASVHDRLIAEGVSGPVGFLREALQRAVRAVESPEMGRQPASPVMEATIWCFGIADALAATALIACMCVPFCWCCFGMIIWAEMAVAIAFCWYEEAVGWR